MARSSTIWVVTARTDYEQWVVHAAFTVKHELITWLESNRNKLDEPNTMIWKTGDGLWQTFHLYKPVNVTTFTIHELLGD